MDRGRMYRDGVNAPAGTGGVNPRAADSTTGSTARRDANGNPLERRAERLGTATVDDNRISWGCINLPVAFYDQHVQTVFSASRTAVVYVLLETRSLQDQFGLHLLTARAGEHSP